MSDDVVQQAKQVLTNLSSVLEAAGSSFNNGKVMWFVYNSVCVFLYPLSVVKTTVLLADLKDYAAVNEVYSQCKHLCDTIPLHNMHSPL